MVSELIQIIQCIILRSITINKQTTGRKDLGIVIYTPQSVSTRKHDLINKTKLSLNKSFIKSPDELVLGLLPPGCARHLGLSAPH